MPQQNTRAKLDSPPAIEIHLDAHNIAVTCVFWCEKLGFREVGMTKLPGTYLEERSVERPDMPGHRFTFHCCAPSPAKGSWKGSLKKIAVRVADLEATAKLIGADARWVVSPSDGPADGGALRVLDPNGYQIELLGDRPAGS